MNIKSNLVLLTLMVLNPWPVADGKMVLTVLLIILLFDFGICDTYNITILHLGDDFDTDVNDIIEKAVNHVNDNTRYKVLANLVSYRFKSNEDVKTVCESISSEVLPDVILDTTWMEEHAIVAEKIALSYGLPTFSTSEIDDVSEFKRYDPEQIYLLKVAKPSTMYHPLIEKIVFIQGMTNVAIIYQAEFVACKSLRSKFDTHGIPSIFILYSRATHNASITTVKKMYFQNIFLLGDIAIKRNEFEDYQLIYSLMASSSDDGSESDVVVFPILKEEKKQKLPVDKMHINVIFHYELTLIAITSVRALIVDNGPEYEDGACDNTEYPSRKDLYFRNKIVQGGELLLLGEFISTNTTKSFMGFIMDVYRLENKLPKQVGTFTISTSYKSDFTNEEYLTSLKRINHYRVLARIKPPFVYYNETTDLAFGYNIDLLDLMASILNFTYELFVIKTNQSDFNDVKSDGFISEMLKREIDIGLGPVYPSVLYRDLDFSIPYYKPIGIKFVMKRSKDDSIFTFITVLETIVWVCILSAFFISSFMLWLAERVSPYSYRNDKERYKDVEDVREFTVKECLWFCLTSLTPQGGGIVPQHFSGRLVVVTWWLFGFIILASYTANLSAFLTLSKMKNPIESFTDLYRQFRMQYAPLNGSDEEAYFVNMAKAEETARSYINANEYPLPNKYSRMNQIILNSTYPNTVDEALERVYASDSATEGFAFLVDSMDAKYLLMTRCNLIDIEEEVGKRPLVIALPKYTLMKHNIDKALTIIMEQRLDVELEKKWWDYNPYKAKNCVELEDESEGIGIYNIGGVFLIIFIGIGIASLMIAFDYFRYVRRQRCRVTMVTPLSNENRLEETSHSDGIEIPKRNVEVDNFSKLQHRNVNRY